MGIEDWVRAAEQFEKRLMKTETARYGARRRWSRPAIRTNDLVDAPPGAELRALATQLPPP